MAQRPLEIALTMKPFSITVHNDLSLSRNAEPVTLGIPFARGVLADVSRLSVQDKEGHVLPSQARVQSKWGDGSVRWALLHFCGDLKPDGATKFNVSDGGPAKKKAATTGNGSSTTVPTLKLDRSETRLSVDTGVLRFDIDAGNFRGFENVRIQKRGGGAWVPGAAPTQLGSLYLKDKDGKVHGAMWGKLKKFVIEDEGPLVVTARIESEIANESGVGFVEYDLWIQAWAGKDVVRAWLTVRNARATSRRVLGNWPLGLGGSVYFKELGWKIAPIQDGVQFVTLHNGQSPKLTPNPVETVPSAVTIEQGASNGEVFRGPFSRKAALVQDSSGGENWFHRNHVNKDWRIPLSYKGWKAFVDGTEIRQGDRADAWIAVEDPRVGVAVGVRHFWQNFPKAVRAVKGPDGKAEIAAALWPEEFADVHELQGGEQKTHELVFHFYRGDGHGGMPIPYGHWAETATTMACALNKPAAFAESRVYAESTAFDHVHPYDNKRCGRYERVNEGSVAGTPFNLFTQIEAVDEYGWRNFGDILADCEGRGRILSHYNLEYDMGYAFLMQCVRTVDERPDLALKWWALGEPALRHESDLDVYHTSEDTHNFGVYNNGKHHHTDHLFEPGRATHRAYEEDNIAGDLSWYEIRGGGPESQHMGSRGMLTYAWMSGYPAALKVVQGLADLIVYKVTTDRFSQTGLFFRDSGHNLQMLNDGYNLTGDRKYLETGLKVIDAGHPDNQDWFRGSPPKSEGSSERAPKGTMISWAGSIFLKEIARFLENQEREGLPLSERAVSAIIQAVEHFNCIGWDEKLGRFAHSVDEANKQYRYPEPWWDYKVLEMVAWACRWQPDAATRKLWLSRAQRNFEEASKLLALDTKTPRFHQSKCSSAAAQNGPGFLALEKLVAKEGPVLSGVERAPRAATKNRISRVRA